MRLLDAEAQERGELAGAARAAGEDAKPLRVTLDLVEQQRRRRVLLDVQLADRAQLQVPVGAAHVLHLAELARLVEPGAQVERVAFLGFSHR
ncbi:hypothetical protein D3C83_03980 [compost metagenome]